MRTWTSFALALLVSVSVSCGDDNKPPDPSIIAAKKAKAKRQREAAARAKAKEAREKKKRMARCRANHKVALARAGKITDKDARKATVVVLNTKAALCLDYAVGNAPEPDFSAAVKAGEQKAAWKKMSPKQRKAWQAEQDRRLNCAPTDTPCMARKNPLMIAASLIDELGLAHRDAVKAARNLRRPFGLRRCQSTKAGLNPSARREFLPAAKNIAKRYMKLGRAVEKAIRAQFKCLTCKPSTPATACAKFLRLTRAAKRALKRTGYKPQ